MLCATTARAFSTSLNVQKWRRWGASSIFTSRPASRHNGMQFSLIPPHYDSAPAALASLLFDPREPQIIGSNTGFRDFSTFSRTLIFFLLTLSVLTLFSSDSFSSLTSLPTVAASVHIEGSLTSKLPSISVYKLPKHTGNPTNLKMLMSDWKWAPFISGGPSI